MPPQQQTNKHYDMKTILQQDEYGDIYEVPMAEYLKRTTKLLKLKDFKDDEGQVVLVADALKHIVNSVTKGREVNQSVIDGIPEAVTKITADIEESKRLIEGKKAAAADEKETKKKAREEAKAKEEEAKQAMLKRQDGFVSLVAEGAKKGFEEFEAECLALKEGLPEGVTITGKDGRFGLAIDKKVTEENIGVSMGYLLQKSANSSFMMNQLQFMVGDAVIATVENGVFQTAKDAGKAINKMLEAQGKRLSIGNIDSYKRMSERTPIPLRNPMADPTAYLAISNMPTPKKGDSETAAEYKKRLAKFEKARESLQAKLSDGTIIKRKDILPLVEDVLVDNGLKQRKEDVDSEPSVSQLLAQFFHAAFGLENLVGLHKKGVAAYQHGDSIHYVESDLLEEVRDGAVASLVNRLYSGKNFTSEELIRGYKKTTKKEKVSEDADGKPIMEETIVKIPVYPNIFFEPEVEEEAAATEE